ncbi:leucine-rich repeat domain-containing protein [Pedobacter sp. KR3-3]|uniref:Leucine-rich repeat domain-containing protein n=1 Tax=Pedobacter albus TaxID=3113905 RepID=A0ABU7I3Y4_9SPHI|nr:leucine-rich repeat domain-containing protein [Pedobacter sp. KR3-3]MEE1944177.1 leucine-rich repeat domain-containing protein [Pedobacter sp. KR3-3]
MRKRVLEQEMLEKELGIGSDMYWADLDSNGHIINLSLFDPEYYEAMPIATDIFETICKFPFLQSIEIDLNDISKSRNINQLAQLKDLKHLTIEGYNQIEDISKLGTLTDLLELRITHAKISDISVLAELTNLKTIELRSSKIEDISPLKGLKSLESLILDNNCISDISSLEGLKHLKVLSLSYNPISNHGALEKLENISSLYIGKTNLDNLAFLKYMPQLENLDVGFNTIEDSVPLSYCLALSALNINSNLISDCSFLAHLRKLRSANISNNPISSYPDVIDQENLFSFAASNIPAFKTGIFKSLNKLAYLILENCGLTDIHFLENVRAVSTLNLANNQIADVLPLQRLRFAKHIDLSSNLIDSVIALSNFSDLEYLDLRGNPFGNLLLTKYKSNDKAQQSTFDDYNNVIGDYYYQHGHFDQALAIYYGKNSFFDIQDTHQIHLKNRFSINYQRFIACDIGEDYFLKFYFVMCLNIVNQNKLKYTPELISDIAQLLKKITDSQIYDKEVLYESLQQRKQYPYSAISEYAKYKEDNPDTPIHAEAIFIHAINTLKTNTIDKCLSIYKELVQLGSPFKDNLFERLSTVLEYSPLEPSGKMFLRKILNQPLENHIDYYDYVKMYRNSHQSAVSPVVSGKGYSAAVDQNKAIAVLLALFVFIALIIMLAWYFIASYPG